MRFRGWGGRGADSTPPGNPSLMQKDRPLSHSPSQTQFGGLRVVPVYFILATCLVSMGLGPS